jgi:FAD/FMN-containing dehydrogenase
LIEAGAFFDRPYGVWADLMYSRTGTYTEYLKKLKVELDPNNIMNPGKLCF